MKKFLVALLILVAPALSVSADPIEGVWRSEALGPPDVVKISPCKAHRGYFCALPAGEGAGKSPFAPVSLAAFKKQEEGEYVAQILGPSGFYYQSSAVLKGEVLNVRRCERWGKLVACWNDALKRVR